MGQTLIKTLLGQLALGGLFEERDEDMDGTPTGPNSLWKAWRRRLIKTLLAWAQWATLASGFTQPPRLTSGSHAIGDDAIFFWLF